MRSKLTKKEWRWLQQMVMRRANPCEVCVLRDDEPGCNAMLQNATAPCDVLHEKLVVHANRRYAKRPKLAIIHDKEAD